MKIKLLNDLATIPTRGSAEAAGYDLYAAIPEGKVVIFPHETVKIGIGIAIEVPKGYFGGIFPRSGISTKLGLRCANAVGAIDSDYRGELIVALHNDSKEIRIVEHGERIAQLIVLPYYNIDNFEIVDELEDTERGSGGFGSTGSK